MHPASSCKILHCYRRKSSILWRFLQRAGVRAQAFDDEPSDCSILAGNLDRLSAEAPLSVNLPAAIFYEAMRAKNLERNASLIMCRFTGGSARNSPTAARGDLRVAIFGLLNSRFCRVPRSRDCSMTLSSKFSGGNTLKLEIVASHGEGKSGRRAVVRTDGWLMNKLRKNTRLK